MRTDTNEFITSNCTVCGEHIGLGFDHSKCSKVKQEMFKDKKHRRNTKTKTIKASDSFANYCRDHYD